MLRLKSATEVIGGVKTDCYAIYFGKEWLCNVSPFDVRATGEYIRAANRAVDRNMAKLKDDAARQAHAIKALHMCSQLGMNRYGLTKHKEVTL